MREGQFIKKNIDRWKSYQEPSDNPDEVAKRFTYLVEDLSYAKTFYPFSNTVKFINSIASGIYLSIYRNKKEKSQRFISFWKTELPLINYQYRRTLLAALIIFLIFVAIGVISAAVDQTFIRSVLGDGYVSITEQNIASGEPFGVYKEQKPFYMFATIAFHNIWLSLLIYCVGISVNILTLYFMLQNGLMLGVFEYMFFHHNLGWRSILVIFIHGTLEISALVIASGASIILGNAVLFPGTHSRLRSFAMAAKDSVKIMIMVVPMLLVAAFFESYVTRHTQMPLWMSLSILISSLGFVLWYFVFYPVKVHKRIKHASLP